MYIGHSGGHVTRALEGPATRDFELSGPGAAVYWPKDSRSSRDGTWERGFRWRIRDSFMGDEREQVYLKMACTGKKIAKT